MSFSILVNEPKLGVKKDLTGKEDFVLAHSPLTVQRDRDDAHAENNVFGSNGTKDMAKEFGDVVKARAH